MRKVYYRVKYCTTLFTIYEKKTVPMIVKWTGKVQSVIFYCLAENNADVTQKLNMCAPSQPRTACECPGRRTGTGLQPSRPSPLHTEAPTSRPGHNHRLWVWAVSAKTCRVTFSRSMQKTPKSDCRKLFLVYVESMTGQTVFCYKVIISVELSGHCWRWTSCSVQSKQLITFFMTSDKD